MSKIIKSGKKDSNNGDSKTWFGASLEAWQISPFIQDLHSWLEGVK